MPSASLATIKNLQKGDLFELLNPFESQLPKQKPQIVQSSPKPKHQKTKPINHTKNQIIKNIKPPKPVEKKKELPKVKINGLVWNSSRPQAIVNGDVLDIGDTIQSFKIVAIEKSGIDILYYGKIVRINH